MKPSFIMLLTKGTKKFKIRNCKTGIRGMMFSSADGSLIKKLPGPFSFDLWMPFVPPLDLYFLSKDIRIIKKEKAIPLSFHPKTWRTYSCKNANYCLEIRSSLKIDLTEKDIKTLFNKNNFFL